jgi:hypothetical protein
VFDGHAGARAAEYAAEHLHVRFLAGLVAYMAMVDQGLVPGMSGQGRAAAVCDTAGYFSRSGGRGDRSTT